MVDKGDSETDGGPGLTFMQNVICENLVDKLKLLNYNVEFCREYNFKPFSKHYFALQTNPGEQFFAFTSCASWLIRKCGKSMEQPQEYDDPNATISEILGDFRDLGNSADFPPSRLKQGYGEHCIYVLDKLADTALQKCSFSWKMPEYPEEEDDQTVIDDDQPEITLEKNEDSDDDDIAVAADSGDDDFEEEAMLDLNRIQKSKSSEESLKPQEILESNTDAAEWKLEVERVMPQLKVTIRTDNKDWRIHVDQMHQHRDGIEKALTETQGQLKKLHDDITRTLEKIGSREKYLNQQLEHLIGEYRTMQDRLAETREKYKQGSGGVTERSRLLAEVTDELERIKVQMDEHGSSMTDSSPLVRIKQAIQKLKTEIIQMNIRTGVVEHLLLRAKLKNRDSTTGTVMITY